MSNATRSIQQLIDFTNLPVDIKKISQAIEQSSAIHKPHGSGNVRVYTEDECTKSKTKYKELSQTACSKYCECDCTWDNTLGIWALCKS